MTAETLAKALGGPRAGGTWMARCPAHGRSARKRKNRLSDEPDADARKRSETALAIWQASQPVVRI